MKTALSKLAAEVDPLSALVEVYLAAQFDGGERYVARLEKVAAMEREMKSGEVTAP